MLRASCFGVFCIIFYCMDFNDKGLYKPQLTILLSVWLMTAIHCGAVETNPFHTLIIVYVTITPAFNMWAKRFDNC